MPEHDSPAQGRLFPSFSDRYSIASYPPQQRRSLPESTPSSEPNSSNLSHLCSSPVSSVSPLPVSLPTKCAPSPSLPSAPKTSRPTSRKTRASILADCHRAEGDALRAALRSGRINASTVTPAQIERIVEGERRKWVIPEKKKRAASRRKSKKRARERDSSLKRAGNRKARESVCEAVKVTRGGEIEVDFRVLFEGGKNGKVPAAKRVNKRE